MPTFQVEEDLLTRYIPAGEKIRTDPALLSCQ